MSATDWSPVCPIPVHTGTGSTAMARATGSESKAARSARSRRRARGRPHRSRQPAAASRARATEAGAPAPGRWARNNDDGEGELRPLQLADEVVVALGAGAGHQADAQGHGGHRQAPGCAGVGPRSRGPSAGPPDAPPAGRAAPSTSTSDGDEVDLALGGIELDPAAQRHHRAGARGRCPGGPAHAFNGPQVLPQQLTFRTGVSRPRAESGSTRSM